MTDKSLRVLIFAAGKLDNNYLSEINTIDFIIACDNAALWLINHQIIPDLAIGDFDSVSRKELDFIRKRAKKCLIFPSQKDQTDLDLAIDYAISLKPKKVLIYGAIGSRMDHSLTAVNLLLKFLDKNIPAKIIDKNNEIFLLKGKIRIAKSNNYKCLSIISFTDKIRVSITGCKYNLTKKVITKSQSLGISNEIVEDRAEIKIHNGIAVVIYYRD